MRDNINFTIRKTVFQKEDYPFRLGTLKSKSKHIASKILDKLKIRKEWVKSPELVGIPSVRLRTTENRYDWMSENKLSDQFHIAPLPAILRNFDKASMMSGIEIRMPFMDHRLVSFVFNLPLKSKIGGGYTKKILRDSMRGILTDSVRNRTGKIGLSAPWSEWVESSLKEYILDTVGSASFLKSEYWNGKSIQEDMIGYYNNKKKIHPDKLWLILNAYIVIQHNTR
jgi:asparagine synthase (glutamine-hydrolysing)